MLLVVDAVQALVADAPRALADPTTTRPLSKEGAASLFSRVTFGWLNDLIRLGNARPLEEDDMWELLPDDRTRVVHQRYEAIVARRGRDPLVTNLFFGIRWHLLWQITCAFFTSFLTFAGPFFLNRIIVWTQTPDHDPRLGWAYLVALFVSAMVKSGLDGQMYFTGRRVGMRVRSIIMTEVYNKALRRATGGGADGSDKKAGDDSATGAGASLGKIVTLMSVDAERIRNLLSYSHRTVVQTPLSTLIAIAGLLSLLGWSAVVGLAVLAVTGPIGAWLGRLINRYQETLMTATDARISLTNEVLNGIRIVKYFSWEKHFTQLIMQARETELRYFLKLWGSYIGFSTIGYGGGLVVAFVTFMTYTLVAGHTLDAATAFTAITLLHQVSNLLAFLPHEIVELYKARVCIRRIQSYLRESELEQFQQPPAADALSHPRTAATLTGPRDALLPGDSDADDEQDGGHDQRFYLRDVTVRFPLGGLSVICGATGSGKSSLVLALLGEMRRLQGDIVLPAFDARHPEASQIAYVAQTAWLINATIRDNICFGEPYEPERYAAVIAACALTRDLETLEGGDLTEIGEKGVNVSGGQKQRISLARAAYSRARIVIMDDPLSAVDAPTARHLFRECIQGVLAGRTRILVSHAVSLVLPPADTAIVLKHGRIVASGPPSALVADPIADARLHEASSAAAAAAKPKSTATSQPSPPQQGTTLVTSEERATGSVKLSVYGTYFRAAGGRLWLTLFILGLWAIYFATFANDWWLKNWTDHVARGDIAPSMSASALGAPLRPAMTAGSPALAPFLSAAWAAMASAGDNNVSPSPPHEEPTYDGHTVQWYILIYGAFGLSVILIQSIETLVWLYGSLVASKRLHRELLQRVLGAPMRFFEITPIGRILNRFSKDIETIDNTVMDAIDHFAAMVLKTITVIVVITWVNPPFILAAAPVMVFAYLIAQMYLNTSRELKRLESVSRSPIYSQFSETLAGITTIRAYNASARFAATNARQIDVNHRSYFYNWTANRWLCLRTDIVAAMVVFCAGVAVVNNGIGPGWAGLMLSYALDFTDSLLWIVRMHAEMEMSMNSVERVQEYMQIEQEPPAIIPDSRPPPGWPMRGQIVVHDVSLRYADDQPDVLRHVSFTVEPGQKVAVVGRTGAGKSTLSLAFFRIIPLREGRIVIDDIDIGKIGLADLRSRLTIIPQDPVLFSGTLRSNMDPFDTHTDDDIMRALDEGCFLGSLQASASLLPSDADGDGDGDDASQPLAVSLDMAVSENGTNFSQGQRQLLCLSRALLHRSRIIFLDEATANVDYETDRRIQQTIRQRFQNGTLLCIAHRCNTIIDYDRVLVLDRGAVLEYDRPSTLLADPHSEFRRMCQETGEFDTLVEMAHQADRGRALRAGTSQ
ncbi:hypothetical protein CXG81DRAFT_10769 [Caulochytrium protostelioides]|uniref:P-loop containing nucleoside triphosphate hydrolase protein n=1 Tax=Caulochytrium protostelioides TaxID=1555241 RepID=A0A4P9XBD2_9FUNG|nr:hypothetical protein CXG81DRAFT_10769 [Caulochytrium protostelioides]|eukprot:RKP02430.1 hypothetical protein CXG81DRAFT_10769 [Caulochytrium protostelioides]